MVHWGNCHLNKRREGKWKNMAYKFLSGVSDLQMSCQHFINGLITLWCIFYVYLTLKHCPYRATLWPGPERLRAWVGLGRSTGSSGLFFLFCFVFVHTFPCRAKGNIQLNNRALRIVDTLRISLHLAPGNAPASLPALLFLLNYHLLSRALGSQLWGQAWFTPTTRYWPQMVTGGQSRVQAGSGQ